LNNSVAEETGYTILVSTVTVLATVCDPLPDQPQRPVRCVPSVNNLEQEIKRGRLPGASAAAEHD
jgi:hypothetical protein